MGIEFIKDMAEAVKATPLDNKWLPVICGATGGILGIVAWLFLKKYPITDEIRADMDQKLNN